MTTKTSPRIQTLYDRDYQHWLMATVEQLKSGQFSALDLENLIEELEGMARSDRRSIKSLLTRLLEHLLKLAYWKTERGNTANHWRSEITVFRSRIQDLLKDSPSLKPYINEVFEECYSLALRSVSRMMGIQIGSLPSEIMATKEQVLDDNWFPEEE